MKTLDKIRRPHGGKSMPKKLAFTFLALLLGFALGVFAKFLDLHQTPSWLWFFDIGNFFGLLLPWAFTALVLAVFSKTPLRAAINVFVFFVGMLLGYYIYCAIFAGFLPDFSYLSVWIVFTIISPLLAAICWYGRGRGTAAIIISALIIAYFILQAFSIAPDLSYFDLNSFSRYSIFPVLFLLGSIGVLFRKPLQSLISVLAAAAFAYIYILLPFSIPYV